MASDTHPSRVPTKSGRGRGSPLMPPAAKKTLTVMASEVARTMAELTDHRGPTGERFALRRFENPRLQVGGKRRGS